HDTRRDGRAGDIRCVKRNALGDVIPRGLRDLWRDVRAQWRAEEPSRCTNTGPRERVLAKVFPLLRVDARRQSSLPRTAYRVGEQAHRERAPADAREEFAPGGEPHS